MKFLKDPIVEILILVIICFLIGFYIGTYFIDNIFIVLLTPVFTVMFGYNWHKIYTKILGLFKI
jgi:hypothetical protein